MPPDDADFATRWRLIKTGFTKNSATELRVAPNSARLAKGEQAIWQHRYWEHRLRDENDYARHVDYIHYNPVNHGLASSAAKWPYSSFSRHVAAGIYPENWGQGTMDLEGIGHE